MSDYLTPEQSINAMFRMIPRVVTEAAMRVGVARGSEFNHRLNGFFSPDFDSVSFRYVYHMSCLDLMFDFHQHDVIFNVWRYRVLGRNETLRGIEKFIDALNLTLHMFMPGIVQLTNFCKCQTQCIPYLVNRMRFGFALLLVISGFVVIVRTALVYWIKTLPTLDRLNANNPSVLK